MFMFERASFIGALLLFYSVLNNKHACWCHLKRFTIFLIWILFFDNLKQQTHNDDFSDKKDPFV